jgi:hypothetical protein
MEHFGSNLTQRYLKGIRLVDKMGTIKLKFVNISLPENQRFVASLSCKIKIYA